MESVEVWRHALLRMTMLPLETLEGFGSAELLHLAADAERAVEAHDGAVSDLDIALHAAIGEVSGPDRSALVRHRRVLRRRGRIPLVEQMPPKCRPIAQRAQHTAAETARRSSDLDTAVERTLASDRHRLREVATTPHFLMALSLANTDLSQQWARVAGRSLDDRSRTRRLEGTIMRYLARAAGRATPNGAWAGVTVCSSVPEPGLRLRPADGGWSVAPNLEPFDLVIQQLRASDDFVRDHRLVLDPLVQPDQCSDHAETTIAEVLLQTGPSTRAELVRRCVHSGIERGVAEAAVDHLVHTGRAVAELRLDVGLGDGWKILEATANDLPPAAHKPWEKAVAGLRSTASELEAALVGVDPVAVVHAIDRGRQILANHRQAAGLPDSTPDPFMVDRFAPVAATWGEDVATSTAALVEALLRFHDELGVAETYRQLATASITGDQPGPGSYADQPAEAPDPDTMHGIFHRRFGSHGRMGVLDDARAAIEAVVTSSQFGTADLTSLAGGDLTPGHMGTLLVYPGGNQLLAGWGRPQPGLFWARLAATDGELADSLPTSRAWGGDTGGALEIVGRDPLNPNAALRALAPDDRLDGWDHASSYSLELDPSGTIWVSRDGDLLRPTYDSASAIGLNDPWSAVLFVAAMSHGWEYLSFGVPVLPRELREPRGLPELRLGEIGSISPRRWIVDEADVAQLLAAPESEAMRLWLRLASSSGWPSLVRVRIGTEPTTPPLLIVTHSPLFLSSLLLSIDQPDRLMVTEVHSAEIAETQGGGRHIVELAIAWRILTEEPPVP
ncbi:MAG: lantibiotic dehydratase [Actinomycetota bacterium]|nr:lantibiotic dehydratase [Actinomycetota bacterium]